MNIVPIIKKASCDYHRLYQPLKYLGVNVDTKEQLPVLIRDAEVVIFNRWAGFEIEHLLRAKKKYGFKIVCDLDDFFELYPNHINYADWNKHEMPRKIREALFNSDYVFVTTEKLADAVKGFNKRTEVIPNGLPFDKEQFTTNTHYPERCQFVYVGGTSHFWDLLSIKNLFYKISSSELRKQLEISLAGYSSKSKEFWRAMEKICSANGRLDFKRREGTEVDNYMTLYDGANVAIAPLEYNRFNSFKSNLKILEAGCKNLPIIVSNVPPYSIEPSDTVLKASSIKDWYLIMEKLIKDRSFREDTGKALGEYVRKNYDLEKINEKRKQIFEYLCQ